MNDEDQNSLQSLEEPGTNLFDKANAEPMAVEPEPGNQPRPIQAIATNEQQLSGKPPKRLVGLKFKSFARHINIYLVLFVILMVILGGVSVYLSLSEDQTSTNPLFPGTSLTEKELEQLRGTDTRVGDPQQTLSIESNTVFAGQVLVRDNLDVAGSIKVGGPLSLTGITVSGSSLFEQVQTNQLNVSGESSLQGAVNVTGNLNVGGNGSFGGALSAPQINVQTLQLGGDLQLSRHIDAGGPSPGRTNSGSLGNGGSSSVSGTDTAGTAIFSTGGGPAAGCYITVNFAQRYNDTPHVITTPSNASAASLDYYVTRNTTSFSICATNNPPGSTNFSFDYIVID